MGGVGRVLGKNDRMAGTKCFNKIYQKDIVVRDISVWRRYLRRLQERTKNVITITKKHKSFTFDCRKGIFQLQDKYIFDISFHFCKENVLMLLNMSGSKL